MVITLTAVDSSKLGGGEVSGPVSSYITFDAPNDGNPGGVVPGEVDSLDILKITGNGFKIGIYYGEVLGTTLGYANGFKLGGKEVLYLIFPDSYFQGLNYGNLDGSVLGDGNQLEITSLENLYKTGKQ